VGKSDFTGSADLPDLSDRKALLYSERNRGDLAFFSDDPANIFAGVGLWL
jgi:hypothetical protein